MASERCAELRITEMGRYRYCFTSMFDLKLGTMGSPFTAIELSLQDKPPAGWQAYAEEDVSRADAYTAARTPVGVLD